MFQECSVLLFSVVTLFSYYETKEDRGRGPELNITSAKIDLELQVGCCNAVPDVVCIDSVKLEIYP